MIVKAYYAGGRIDVFDTDHMVDRPPQPGNLLTNYTLELADVNDESLWLRSYYYEAVQAYKDEPGPKGLPVARRRDGWSFLVADAEDIQKLNRLTVDGETVLVRIADELVDVSALSWVYDVAEEYVPQAVIAHGFLMRAFYGKDGDLAEAASNAAGFSAALAPFLQSMNA
ncbi:hypothetical protein [Gordonibacter sp. 28C]|uniref:hypothetical protein n=1 Tax=Gordonibacter sp. 28C TaxID=2078569 RepID=UPI001F5404F4|nr:hypothetical protein [Gordonibacter sp. 28C]